MEMMDIVNENDEVVGTASKDQIYAQKHMHRIAHVLVFDSMDRLLLQKRSADHVYCPSHWSTSVGGHVQAGESYIDGAMREYLEELGTSSHLEHIGTDRFDGDQGITKFLGTYKTTCEEPFNLDTNDIDSVEFFTLDEVRSMLESGEPFHPELMFILDRYFGV